MKLLTKPEFLTLLKGIVKVFESENVKYDIPYCHITKDTYNYINILVIENITIGELNKFFELSQVKEKDNVIYTKIDGFNVNFIRTSTQNWGYAFVYYSWDVLPYLIDAMVRPLGMHYSSICLEYVHGVKRIELTRNMKEIFDLLGMNFGIVALGFSTVIKGKMETEDYRISAKLQKMENIFTYIITSPLYDQKAFSIKSLKAIDPMFEYNKEYYEEFIRICPPIKCDLEDDMLEFLDRLFPKARLLEKIAQMELKKIQPGLKFDVKKNEDREETIDRALKSKEKEVAEFREKKKIKLKRTTDVPKENENGDYEIEL